MLKPLKDRVVIQIGARRKNCWRIIPTNHCSRKLQFAKVIATSEFTAAEDRQSSGWR